MNMCWSDINIDLMAMKEFMTHIIMNLLLALQYHGSSWSHVQTDNMFQCYQEKQGFGCVEVILVVLCFVYYENTASFFPFGCKHLIHRGHISSHQCCGGGWKALGRVLHNTRQTAACSQTWVTYSCLCYCGIWAGWVWNVCFDFRGLSQGGPCVCVCVYVRVNSQQITLTCLASVFNSSSMAKN